ncbi:hypothetical protein KC19_9G036900 [Ceratodon purpureus]|uniref:Uncharacterized protein n=1 Tax=Ceratodon purpureus TaxID=3225 RepID=A0A8T0GTV1_CERPU|nr:hypothetical protein KC19_9G036900 [Ceratodon purpureus]
MSLITISQRRSDLRGPTPNPHHKPSDHGGLSGRISTANSHIAAVFSILQRFRFFFQNEDCARHKRGCFDMVACHVLIDHVLEFACAPADPWVVVDRLNVDSSLLLELIAKLATLSKEWKAAMRSRVEYNALRAAPSLRKFHLPVGGRKWLLHRRGNRLAEFHTAVAVFTKSWSFTTPLPMRLRTQPLGELLNSELNSLLAFLMSGWNLEVHVIPGDGQEELETVWVTPDQRSKRL